MIILLAQIGPAGMRRPVQMALSTFPRLNEMVGPQTESLSGELLLKNRRGHIEVTGEFQAKVRVTCSRCLDPVLLEIEEEIRVTLAPENESVEGLGDETQLQAEDLDVSFYTGDSIDLLAVLEEELILLIQPACEETDDGMCTCCGRSVAEVLKPAEADEAFHPLAGLRSLIQDPGGKKS